MYKNLPEMVFDKIIPRNFGHIGHLLGSKMISDDDKLVGQEEETKFTVCKRDKNDLVIITEKMDGMNAGVVKKNGVLYPTNRKGYDSRSMGMQHEDLTLLGNEWARWVDEHYELYDFILEEGERLVFENCMMQHTLKYKFKTDPVFLLAKYKADNKRFNYHDLTRMAKAYDIQQPTLINIGVAIPPQLIINQFTNPDKIEGIVYSYEYNGEVESNAKFVSNKLIGTTSPMAKYYNVW